MAIHNLEPSLRELRDNLSKTNRQNGIWEQPIQFDPDSIADRNELNRRFGRGEIRGSINRFETIADDMFELNNPDKTNDTQARVAYVEEVLNDQENYSSLFYLPWRRELWQFPNKPLHLDLRLARYNPIVRPGEQKDLYFGKTSLVAGLSVGSSIEETLVMAGICDQHVVADFDTLSLTNTGRSTGRMDRVGGRKIDNIACDTSEVDPYIQQTLLRKGISSDSLTSLGSMGVRPDIIFDEVDNFQAKAQLRIYASENRIPLVMMTDLGDKSVAEIENYATGNPNPFNGAINTNLFEKMSENRLTPKEHKAVLKNILGLRNLTPRLLQSTTMIGKEIVSFPQEGAVARVGGGAGALIAREIILGRHTRSGSYTIDLPEILHMKRPDKIKDEVHMVVDAIKYMRKSSSSSKE